MIRHRNRRRTNEAEQQRAIGTNNNNRSVVGPGGTPDQSNSVLNRSNQRRRRRRTRVRITYEVDPATGERIAVRTKIRRKPRKTRKQRERARMVAKASRSVKGRLALQLGLCSRGNNVQSLNVTRPAENNSNIGKNYWQRRI